MNKKLKSITVITIISLLFFSACNKQAAETSKKSEEETVTSFAVSTTLAVKGEIKDYLQLNGDIAAKTTVDTFADTAGKLKILYVKVGDTVQKDQVIAEVDPSRPGMTFAASPVKASISGTVTQVPVQIGSVVAPNFPIAKISKMNELEVIIYVAERFVSKLKIGLPAVIKADAYPGVLFKGSISELSPIVDKASRTMEVKLKLKDPDSLLKAGMFAVVKLIIEEKEGIVKIPSEAMIKRFGESYVFVLSKDPSSGKQTVEKREVIFGLRIDNQLEIIQGLAEDEVIVIRGQTLLEDGSFVKIISSIDPIESTDTVE